MIPTLAAALLLPVAALALPTSHTLIQRGDPEACSKIAGQDCKHFYRHIEHCAKLTLFE